MIRGRTTAIKMMSMAMLIGTGLGLTSCAAESSDYPYAYPPVYGDVGFDFDDGFCCGGRFHDFHHGFDHGFHGGGEHGFAHAGGFGGGHGGGGHGR